MYISADVVLPCLSSYSSLASLLRTGARTAHSLCSPYFPYSTAISAVDLGLLRHSDRRTARSTRARGYLCHCLSTHVPAAHRFHCWALAPGVAEHHALDHLILNNPGGAPPSHHSTAARLGQLAHHDITRLSRLESCVPWNDDFTQRNQAIGRWTPVRQSRLVTVSALERST